MPGPEWPILWIAPALFLAITLAKLLVQELITLIVLLKKLRATLGGEYSLALGKLKSRHRTIDARPSSIVNSRKGLRKSNCRTKKHSRKGKNWRDIL
jgi:hypothetical protein